MLKEAERMRIPISSACEIGAIFFVVERFVLVISLRFLITVMPKAAGKQTKGKTEVFTWADDEVELLLKVTNEYKVQKSTESVDWESVQPKYADILVLFQELCPSSENASALGKEYTHRSEDITKASISSKLKAIRNKFRQAVDSRKKSGYGRVVLLYFELCQEIWCG